MNNESNAANTELAEETINPTPELKGRKLVMSLDCTYNRNFPDVVLERLQKRVEDLKNHSNEELVDIVSEQTGRTHVDINAISDSWYKQSCSPISFFEDIVEQRQSSDWIEYEAVEIFGSYTEIDVLATALMAKCYFNCPIYVNTFCTTGMSPKGHRAALEIMRYNGIEVF